MSAPRLRWMLARLATGLRRTRRRVQIGHAARPVSEKFGFDRGRPIDRYYIEAFLARFAGFESYTPGAIQGRVLEIGGREYAQRFAPPDATIDVLHENAANPEATVVGDLTVATTLEEGAYDCIICTQVLPVIWDVPAALATLHRALSPGGVLLATVPGITKALTPDRDHWGDWWRFTASSARRLVEAAFPGGRVEVEAYGNLRAATAFLHGYAAEEFSGAELDLRDPEYEVTVAIRAIKAA